jgi:hypothetical protein
MANTTNFGWETPDDTDLVKDGAAAMRTLGSAIDTSFVDLKGGTTGQLLSKASNSDLDFSWTTVGSSLEGWTLLNSGGTNLSGSATVTVSGISNRAQLLIFVRSASSANASSFVGLRLNSDSGSNYIYGGLKVAAAASPSNVEDWTSAGNDQWFLGKMGNTAGARVSASARITGATSTSLAKGMIAMGSGDNVSTAEGYAQQGLYTGTSAITSISILSSTGNFDAGSVWVYGSDN